MSAISSMLISTFLWAAATQFYSWLGRQMPVRRLNFYKSVVSLFLFLLVCLYQRQLMPPDGTIYYLLLSGVLGFALGDLCIFYAFSKLGSARTLMIASFVPGILAIQSFFFLGLELNSGHLIGLGLMFTCMIFLSLDKMEGVSFDWKLALIALVGFSLDSSGIILSKKAFIAAPGMGSSLANFYRILVAVIFLGVLNIGQGVRMSVRDLSGKIIFYVILSSFLGTFLALFLFLHALSQGHPAVLASLGGLTPVYSAIYEYGIRKSWPSRFFFAAMVTMGVGVWILIRSGA